LFAAHGTAAGCGEPKSDVWRKAEAFAVLTATQALVWALRTGRTERLSLEKVNGGPVLGTPLAEALLAAGFYSSPSGIRFRN